MSDAEHEPRRGLVFEGGGGKGAFAIGCMKALHDHGIKFSAVAGTSAGGLCALIFSTQRLEDGEAAWTSLGSATFFGDKPDGCLRRLAKGLLVAGKLFVGFVRGIDFEGQPQYLRDLSYSVLLGLLYWLLFLGVLKPLWWWVFFPIIVPLIALSAATNTLPRVGFDTRVRQWILDFLLWLGTCKTVLGIASWWILTPKSAAVLPHITPVEILTPAFVVGAVLIALDLPATLIEGKRLAVQVESFVKSTMTIPTYVTIAKECAPGSPRFLITTPGVFYGMYVRLDRAPPDIAAALAYASAALPFGILPPVRIGEHEFVDGGVADNTPLLPLLSHELDEIWIVRLRPGTIDVEEHLRNLRHQQLFASGVGPDSDAFWMMTDTVRKTVKFVQITPQTSLGGMLTGTLNFTEHRSRSLIRHGYRVASRIIANPVQELRVYRRRFSWRERLRFLRRALPGCNVKRIFARGTADTSLPHPTLGERPLAIPAAVQPASRGHGKPVRSALVFCAAVIGTALSANAFSERRTAAAWLWAIAAFWTLFIFPSWWPRFKRMQGIR